MKKVSLKYLRKILLEKQRKFIDLQRASVHPCTCQYARCRWRDVAHLAYFLKILIEANQLAQRGFPEIPARVRPQKMIISTIYLLKPLRPPRSLAN